MATTRLEHAQRILAAFAPHVRLWQDRGYWFGWEVNGVRTCRRWQTRGGSDYPVWYSSRPFGGTGCVACSALVKWLRGESLHLPFWEYVCRPEVGFPPETLERVKAAIAEE
jgi:hypothetical protein